MLYNSSGLRSGYILVVILMTLARDQRTFWKVKILLEIANDPNKASCLIFTWFFIHLVLFTWLLPLLWTFYGLFFVCVIIKIVLQHKVRVQFLKKQREKGPDSWYSPENRIRIGFIRYRLYRSKSGKGALPNYESCCQTCCCMTWCSCLMFGQMHSAMNKYQCWHQNRQFTEAKISMCVSLIFLLKVRGWKGTTAKYCLSVTYLNIYFRLVIDSVKFYTHNLCLK